MDENEILLSDILNFLKAIAVREFRASGPQHYQHFEDILTLLKELEAKEADKHGTIVSVFNQNIQTGLSKQ